MTDNALVVYALMFVCGLLYNQLVAYTQAQLPNRHGVTSLMVVGGVAWTLLGVLLLTSLQTFLIVLLCFVASGTPMVIGSIWRYWQGEP